MTCERPVAWSVTGSWLCVLPNIARWRGERFEHYLDNIVRLEAHRKACLCARREIIRRPRLILAAHERHIFRMNSLNQKTHSTFFTAPIDGRRGRRLLAIALMEAKDLLELQPFVIADLPAADGRYRVTFSSNADVISSRAYA